jgi:hypothetical protein
MSRGPDSQSTLRSCVCVVFTKLLFDGWQTSFWNVTNLQLLRVLCEWCPWCIKQQKIYIHSWFYFSVIKYPYICYYYVHNNLKAQQWVIFIESKVNKTILYIPCTFVFQPFYVKTRILNIFVKISRVTESKINECTPVTAWQLARKIKHLLILVNETEIRIYRAKHQLRQWDSCTYAAKELKLKLM